MTVVADPWVALADPTRRQILIRVLARPRSVGELADGLPVSRPAVSQHLRVLKQARLVSARRDGKQQIYAPRADGLVQLRSELESFWGQALASFKQLAEGESEHDPDQHLDQAPNGDDDDQ